MLSLPFFLFALFWLSEPAQVRQLDLSQEEKQPSSSWVRNDPWKNKLTQEPQNSIQSPHP